MQIMTFAEKLQRLRKQNGLSQEQLAEKLNVSRQAVSKWEMGTIPDMENMVKLGRNFDCSLDYLMKDEGNIDHDQAINKRNTDVRNSNGMYLDSLHPDRRDTCFIDAVICKMVSGI